MSYRMLSLVAAVLTLTSVLALAGPYGLALHCDQIGHSKPIQRDWCLSVARGLGIVPLIFLFGFGVACAVLSDIERRS